jgi:hypothetical protein
MLAMKCEAGAGDILKSCITLRKQTAKRRMQRGESRVPRTGCISRLAFDLLQIAWSGSHAPFQKLDVNNAQDLQFTASTTLLHRKLSLKSRKFNPLCQGLFP